MSAKTSTTSCRKPVTERDIKNNSSNLAKQMGLDQKCERAARDTYQDRANAVNISAAVKADAMIASAEANFQMGVSNSSSESDTTSESNVASSETESELASDCKDNNSSFSSSDSLRIVTCAA